MKIYVIEMLMFGEMIKLHLTLCEYFCPICCFKHRKLCESYLSNQAVNRERCSLVSNCNYPFFLKSHHSLQKLQYP